MNFQIRYFHFLAPLLILIIWGASVLLVNPVGDFPISDDWAYAQSVRELLSTGHLRFSDWGAMNLISHVAWGGLFGLPFGPDYTILRISTLFLAIAGSFALYRVCRLCGASIVVALLATAVGTLNPLYFFLSFSYMTDTAYAATQMLAVALIAGQKPLTRSLGWASGVAGLLSRQTGLAIPLAWGAAKLREPWSFRNVALAVAPLAAFVLIQIAYVGWLRASGILPQNFGLQISAAIARLAANPSGALASAYNVTLSTLFYIGLFALPLTTPFVLSAMAGLGALKRAAAIALWPALIVAVTVVLLRHGRQFPPLNGTIFVAWGIGTEDSGVPMSEGLILALTLASAAGALFLVFMGAHAAVALVRARNDRVANMVTLLGAALFAPVPFITPTYDRYLIPIIPCVAAMLVVAFRQIKPSPPTLAVGAACASVMAALSIAATHDFMAWKTAQHTAYERALTLAPAELVDGGWVLNGERFFPRFESRVDLRNTWHLGRDYVVVPHPLEGYQTIETYPVARWLAQGNMVFLQRKIDQALN